MAGSLAGGVTYRGQVATAGLVKHETTLENAVADTFNPVNIGLDLALGAGSGILSYGIGHLLAARTAGGTAAPSRAAPVPGH